MNAWLWAGQILLAVSFAAAGLLKLAVPKDKLRGGMPWVDDMSQAAVRGIGAVELAGAAGVVLPWATGIATVLTPAAAIGIAALMIGGLLTHLRRGEYARILSNVAFFAIAVLVALGRLT
jgi:uncharacterized membrane protein